VTDLAELRADGAGEDLPRLAPSRRHPIASFLVRRLALGVVTLFAASILIFLATEALPGNVAEAVLGKSADPVAVHQLERRLGLDRPLATRYVDWLDGLVHGDLGNSAAQLAEGVDTAPIWPTISKAASNTAILAGLTVAFLVPLSLGLGVLTALSAGGKADHGASITTLVLISLPEFVLGSLLILVFFAELHWLPPVALVAPNQSPLDEPKALILPVLTLLLTNLAWTTRFVRAGMIEALATPYVELARLNGVRERRVVLRYALRNALAPSVQIFALAVQYLIGGVIVVEMLYAYPGLGKQLVDSVGVRDETEVEAIAMLLATAYILINIVADLLVVLLVPKLRTAQ
jgi:peptide/nickel transport system permease protein